MSRRIHDPDAERSLLACIMHADADVPVAARDFDHAGHRLIFDAITAVRARGRKPDPVTVAAELGDSLDRFGGKPYLLEVSGAEATATNAARYAEIVGALARRRRLVEASVLIRAAAESGDDYDAFHAIEEATAEHPSYVRHASVVLRERLESIGEKREYVWLERFPGVHLHFGDLCILAARPSVGKSAFALQLAAEFAERHLRIRVYSLEMHAEDWIDRLIMQRTPFSTDALDDGLTSDQASHVAAALGPVHDWPLDVCDRNMGVDQVVADIHRFGRRGGRIVVIDYLQLLIGAERGQSRYEAVTEASRKLKVAAAESRVLVLALSQLSRGSIGTDGKPRPPVMSDLRESGALEQDADDIMLLHRYDDDDLKARADLREKGYLLEYDGDVNLGEKRYPVCHLDFAKLRRGMPRRTMLWWVGEDQTFIEIDRSR